MMRQISVPVLIVPGNHDIGHMVGSGQPVNADRLQRWRDLVGTDHWHHDADGWRLIGINSLIIGHQSQQEEEQYGWLLGTLQSAGSRRIAIFTHKPLFIDDPKEGETGYWGMAPADRARFLDLIRRHDVALFASGHVHRAHIGQFENTSMVWGPSSAFLAGKDDRPMPGDRMVGAVLHRFSDAVRSEIVTVPGITAHEIDDVVPKVYPSAEHVSAAE